jgi:hypothetical protein
MATNTWKAKSKSKHSDLTIFFAEKWNMNANVSFTICSNVPGDFTLKVLKISHSPGYPSEILHIHCCHLVDSIGITTRVMDLTVTFLLHFKDCGKKNTGWCFLCIFFYQIYYVIFSYIQFTFPQTSKCFLSNGTKNMHILASGPDLWAVRFGYVI